MENSKSALDLTPIQRKRQTEGILNRFSFFLLPSPSCSFRTEFDSKWGFQVNEKNRSLGNVKMRRIFLFGNVSKHFSSKSCQNQFYPHDSEKKKKADRAFASAHRRGSSATGRARQEGQSWNSRPDLLSKFFTKTTPRCANTLSLKSLFRLSCEKDFSHHAGIDSNTT